LNKTGRQKQDALYEQAFTEHRAMIRRLACGYEAETDRRRDLLQDIHLELWRSLESFNGRCALRTWMYRVAHNVGASYIGRQRRVAARLVDLEALETEPVGVDGQAQADNHYEAQKLLGLIHPLRPADRQIILLYLEGEAAADIADVTGLSASNIATKIHRIKKLLQQQYMEGISHE
jgi:RNA polymerase sigma-70 factor (ECF subfamily)